MTGDWRATTCPGPGYAVIGPSFVLLTTALTPETSQALWEMVRRPDVRAFDLIGALGGTDLASMPDFALLLPGEATRVVVRGQVGVSIVGRPDLSWSAPAVSTWSEHVLPDGVGTVALTWGTVQDCDLPLPVREGVVRCGAVLLDVGGADSAADPAVTPSPESVRVDPADGGHPPALTPRPPAADVEQPQAPEHADAVPESPEAAHTAELMAADEAAAASDRQDAGSFDGDSGAGQARHPLELPTVIPSALVDSVPTRSQETLLDPIEESYDALFGASVARRPEEAAVRPAVEEGAAGVGTSEVEDHTIAGLSRRDLVRSRRGHPAAEGSPGRSGSVRVTLAFSDGRSYQMGSALFVGRSPEALGSSLDRLPELVSVESPNHDISRTHVELRMEDEALLVRDVSTNGTVLTRPGRPPERLSPRVDTLLNDGCVIDLGDGVRVEISVREGD
jgi:hypothetical protein